MRRLAVIEARKSARLAASLYVNSENGPTSPGRWQPAQFFQRIGAICFEYVTGDEAAGDGVAASATTSSEQKLDMTRPIRGEHEKATSGTPCIVAGFTANGCRWHEFARNPLGPCLHSVRVP